MAGDWEDGENCPECGNVDVETMYRCAKCGGEMCNMCYYGVGSICEACEPKGGAT